MMNATQTFPPKISLRAARVNANFMQKEAACKLGIDRATLMKYEKGITTPNWNMVEKIEKLYNYPANYIFFGSNTRLKQAK